MDYEAFDRDKADLVRLIETLIEKLGRIVAAERENVSFIAKDIQVLGRDPLAENLREEKQSIREMASCEFLTTLEEHAARLRERCSMLGVDPPYRLPTSNGEGSGEMPRETSAGLARASSWLVELKDLDADEYLTEKTTPRHFEVIICPKLKRYLRALDTWPPRPPGATAPRGEPSTSTVGERQAHTESSEPEPDFYFRKRGDVWEARFNGREKIVLNSVNKGAEYINYLLGHPNTELQVFDIVGRRAVALCNFTHSPDEDYLRESDGFQVTNSFPLGDAGEIADSTAIAQYKSRAVELLRDVSGERAAGNSTRVQELEEEIAQVAQAIEEATGLGGRRRKAKDARKSVRDAFAKAVRRAIDRIHEYDKPLADHLRRHIRYGNTPGYYPDREVSWEL